MPVILRIKGLKFFFYSNEGQPPEPAHIHVRHAGSEAKFWLTPEVKLARNDGFDAHTLRRIEKLVTLHRKLFEDSWNEYIT
ncbi:hypothetical protein M911_09090 [Ectothiorhodospira haloalkaliphila]|uniref:DUF4160 domain-containing protein n=1 Tax=Ectothiorhodospira haloalkaliphila TaxID=421628 RepID=W8L5W2_9GAMM|nr:DUF4160 domain-containing protein [Ectothiorhodospira haloalkaliphila]AHK79275.1 hypothetical protein M911_09090 [Ectothiorhodospira haloalkaliphila]